MKPNEQEYSGFWKVMSEISQRYVKSTEGGIQGGSKKKDVNFKNFLKIKAVVRSNTELNETNKKGQKLLRCEGQDVGGGLATYIRSNGVAKKKNNGQQTNKQLLVRVYTFKLEFDHFGTETLKALQLSKG